MRHRNLAAIAATATVAATPAVATVIEDVTTAPPAAADAIPIGKDPNFGLLACYLQSPIMSPDGTVLTSMWGPYKGHCWVPGTLSLQASADHSRWKNLAQTHGSSGYMSHRCLAGTWWYQGYFAADDGSLYGGTDRAAPTQFTC